MPNNERDVLEDKVFTKTAFAIRIDQLEAQIKWEREQRANLQKQLSDMTKQFHLLNMTLTQIITVTEQDSNDFWKVLSSYLPQNCVEILEKLTQYGKPVTHGLSQALRYYGMKKIGGKDEIKNKTTS